MYTYILFDFDGTLFDTSEGVTNSAAYALEKMRLPVPENRNELKKFIGPPLLDSFHQFYGLDETDAKTAMIRYREYYKNKGIFELKPYPGMEELLKQLQASGRTAIVATSKPEIYTKRILEHVGWTGYFSFVGGATMDEKTRATKPQILQYILDTCHITDIREAVMVGDRHYDIRGARAFGMDSIGVLYGFGTKEELSQAGATYLAEDVGSLLCYL